MRFAVESKPTDESVSLSPAVAPVTHRPVSDGMTLVSPTVRIHEATSGYASPLAANVIWPWIPAGAAGAAAAGGWLLALASSVEEPVPVSAVPAGVTAPWNDVNHTVPGIVFEMSCSMWLHETSVASSDVTCASSWSTCAACALRSALSSIEDCNSALCRFDRRLLVLLVGQARLGEVRRHTEQHDQSGRDRQYRLERARRRSRAALRLAACTRREVDDGADAGTTEREADGGRQVRVEARVARSRGTRCRRCASC